MFRVDERYSGNKQRKYIKETKSNEPYRQILRKKSHPISRELDNYFGPKLHKRSWFPNGKYIVKKNYYYANPGLGFNYEKHNIEQLKDLIELQNEKANKLNKQKNFVDYKYTDVNQYVITIEYCSNCKEHSKITSHKADLYKNYALSLQKCILLRFPFITVLLKPIETDIQNGDYKLPKVEKNGGNFPLQYLNNQYKEVRIGAFEVQLFFKSRKEEEQIVILHSKLETKRWPKIETILGKIVSYMPKFMGRIIVYQKEKENEEIEQKEKKEEEDEELLGEGETRNPNGEGEIQQSEEQKQNKKDGNNNQDNLKIETFEGELIEGLKISIYLQKNNQITQISNNSWEDIQKEKDPHKRRIMDREKIIKEKQEMYKSKAENSSVIENKNFNRSRPSSAYSHRQNYSINRNNRPNSSKNKISLYTENDYINSGYNPMEENLILDKEVAENYKGRLLITKYTNSEGYIDIGPLPYDSYYIEVSESKQYGRIGLCLVFNKLAIKTNHYIKRYIGLLTQENSFIQIHVFETKRDDENKEDPIHITGATVTIETARDENKEDYLEDKEWKFEIKEKQKSPGIFEQTVAPGKYILRIKKNDYETVTKTCLFQKGFNSINIELFKERTCKLLVKVFNYEKLIEDIHAPIQNADVVIYQNANEILEQGITDNKGELEYIVDKGEDFLTIVINKMGYFPIQRTFIRDKNMKINELNQYEDEMIFFLVKKSFIYNTKCMLFNTYCNIKKNNFLADSIDINSNIDKVKYPVSCLNAQESDGLISMSIFTRDDEIDNTQTQNNVDTQNNENIENNDNNGNNPDNDENNNLIEEENQNQENEEGNRENIITENDENNNEQEENNNSEKRENFDNIMNFTLIINSDELLIHNYQDKGHILNGLERYGCQTIIYTPKNTFYVSSPVYCKEGYKYWNIGWIDYKNQLFYQTNTLLENRYDRYQFLSLWIDFLQTLINNQIYKNLFNFFGFQGSTLINKDRFIYEPLFKKILLSLKFCNENDNEALQFICDLFKSNNNMISYGLIKKKISSNLKNFFDGIENQNSSSTFGINGNESSVNEVNNQV